MFKTNKILVILVLISIITTAMIFARLPDKISFHWNIKGEIDAWSNKKFS